MIHISFEKVIETLALSIEKTVDELVWDGHISTSIRDAMFDRFDAHLDSALASLKCELNK